MNTKLKLPQVLKQLIGEYAGINHAIVRYQKKHLNVSIKNYHRIYKHFDKKLAANHIKSKRLDLALRLIGDRFHPWFSINVSPYIRKDLIPRPWAITNGYYALTLHGRENLPKNIRYEFVRRGKLIMIVDKIPTNESFKIDLYKSLQSYSLKCCHRSYNNPSV